MRLSAITRVGNPHTARMHPHCRTVTHQLREPLGRRPLGGGSRVHWHRRGRGCWLCLPRRIGYQRDYLPVWLVIETMQHKHRADDGQGNVY